MIIKVSMFLEFQTINRNVPVVCRIGDNLNLFVKKELSWESLLPSIATDFIFLSYFLSQGDDFSLKKSSDEIKKLHEEISSLRQENIQLKVVFLL